jgi:SAM-dependent methyltransferase
MILDRLAQRLSEDRSRTEQIKRTLRAVGYEPLHWMRVVTYRECLALVEQLVPEQLDVLEIGAGHMWQRLPFRTYTTMNYPEYDICRDVLNRQFDLVISDNVFEHLSYPHRAGRNVLTMLRPNGHFLNITLFLVRIHLVPMDCSRWTQEGMRYLLEECGFDPATMVSGAWGNRACVRANLRRWVRRGWFRSLKNESAYPCQVWVLARKPA